MFNISMALALPGDLIALGTRREVCRRQMRKLIELTNLECGGLSQLVPYRAHRARRSYEAPRAARSSKASESGESPLLHRLLAYLEWGPLSSTVSYWARFATRRHVARNAPCSPGQPHKSIRLARWAGMPRRSDQLCRYLFRAERALSKYPIGL